MQTDGFHNLATIARKYKTDKVDYHGYIPVYEELLEANRLLVRRVLEIGIGTPQIMIQTEAQKGYQAGASLRMWEEYFPNAEIIGIDCLPEAMVNEGRIKSVWHNQGDYNETRRLAEKLGKFDFIVDDGSHVPIHQFWTADIWVKNLNPGGILVIEDVLEPDFVCSQLDERFPNGNYELRICNVEQLADDRLVIIRA